MRNQMAAATRQPWEIERDRRNCLAELQEVAKIRLEVMRDLLPSFILHDDGHVERFYPPYVHEILAKLDEMSKCILSKYGVDLEETNHA